MERLWILNSALPRNTRIKVWNMFKVNYKATKTTPWCRFGGFIVNYEHVSHLCSSVSIVNFKQVNAGWVIVCFYICLKNVSTEHLPHIFSQNHCGACWAFHINIWTLILMLKLNDKLFTLFTMYSSEITVYNMLLKRNALKPTIKFL